MSQITETSTRNVTQQYSHLPSNERESGGVAAAPWIGFAAMILDKSGTVCYCHGDAARLFRASPHTLVGRHIRDLIPGLPFNARTPGYNIAYATFWGNASPRWFCGLDTQGDSFGLQVALTRPHLMNHYQIIVVLAPCACSHGASATVRRCCDNGVDVRADRTDIPAFAE